MYMCAHARVHTRTHAPYLIIKVVSRVSVSFLQYGLIIMTPTAIPKIKQQNKKNKVFRTVPTLEQYIVPLIWEGYLFLGSIDVKSKSFLLDNAQTTRL